MERPPLPRVYAAQKQRTLLRRLEDRDIRSACEKWGPVFVPGLPLSALIASGCTSQGRHEWGGPPDYATGLFGVEWERVKKWATEPATVAEFGRELPTAREAWERDVEAQVYAGFRSYRAHLDACVSRIPAKVAPSVGSPWWWALALSSYSSGVGTSARIVTAAADELAAVLEVDRWAELGRFIVRRAAEGDSRVGSVRIRGKWKAAHTVWRFGCRAACGEALAAEVLHDAEAWHARLALPDALAVELIELAAHAATET